MKGTSFKKVVLVILCCSIILLGCKSKEINPNKNKIENGAVESIDYSQYIGRWNSTEGVGEYFGGTVVNIVEINDQMVSFEVEVLSASFRVATTGTITSILEEEQTTFTFNDDFDNSGKGVLTFREDYIVANLEYTTQGSFDFGVATNCKLYRYQNADEYSVSPTATYMPDDGAYSNGSDKDRQEIIVTKTGDLQFRFSIYQGGDLIFKEHVAVFENRDEPIAVYRGENYTLYFDCTEYATIILKGFEEVIEPPGNIFWNSELLHSS